MTAVCGHFYCAWNAITMTVPRPDKYRAWNAITIAALRPDKYRAPQVRG